MGEEYLRYIIVVPAYQSLAIPNIQMSKSQQEYQTRMDQLSGKERVARAMGMLQWTREMLARQIVEELGEMSHERLKWEVALRLYSADQRLAKIIARKLADVSR